MLEPARTDAIRPLFVFLDLLERQTECTAELFLAHMQHKSTHAHSVADMLLDWVRRLLHAVPRASDLIIIFLYLRRVGFGALQDFRPIFPLM